MCKGSRAPTHLSKHFRKEEEEIKPLTFLFCRDSQQFKTHTQRIKYQITMICWTVELGGDRRAHFYKLDNAQSEKKCMQVVIFQGEEKYISVVTA